jgi:hypothetical protein
LDSCKTRPLGDFRLVTASFFCAKSEPMAKLGLEFSVQDTVDEL